MLVFEESYIKTYFLNADKKSGVLGLSRRHEAWRRLNRALAINSSCNVKNNFLEACVQYDITKVKLRNSYFKEDDKCFFEENKVNILFIDGVLWVQKTEHLIVLASSPGEPWYTNQDFSWPNLTEELDMLTLMNMAAVISGISCVIKKNCSLLITYVHKDRSDGFLVNYRNNIKLAPGIRCFITEQYISLSKTGKSALNIANNLFLTKDTICTFSTRTHKEKRLILHTNHKFFLYQNSNLEVLFLPQKLVFYELKNNLVLLEKSANVTLGGFSSPGRKGKIYADILVEHLSSHTRSNIEWRSIGLADSITHVLYKSIISSEREDISILQYHHHLQLEDEAKVVTQPILEIASPDVKAYHGVTVGCLRESEQLYMQTRALCPRKIKILFAESFGLLLLKRYNIVRKVCRKQYRAAMVDVIAEIKAE